MAVLELVEKSNKDTIEACAYMLYEAQQGRLSGINGTFRRPDGEEEGLSTGAYKARPELALMAIMKMSQVLLRDETDDEPD